MTCMSRDNGCHLLHTVQELQTAVQAAVEAAGLRVKRFDKKVERQMVHSHRKALQARLVQEEDPAAALSLAVPLLLAQVQIRHMLQGAC